MAPLSGTLRHVSTSGARRQALLRGFLAAVAVGTAGNWTGVKILGLALVAGLVFADLGRRDRSDAAAGASDFLGLGIQASFVLILMAAAWDNREASSVTHLPGLLEVAGSALIIAALRLRKRAVEALGRHFTVKLAVLDQHRLIDDGPYRHVRHPNYASLGLVAVGTALCLRSPRAALVAVCLWLPTILLRIVQEESLLARAFGSSYESYARRTWRLVPGVF